MSSSFIWIDAMSVYAVDVGFLLIMRRVRALGGRGLCDTLDADFYRPLKPTG